MGSRRKGQPNDASVSQPLPSFSRRDLLAGTAVTIACAFVPASSLQAAPLAPAPTPTEVLTGAERQSLEAVVRRIIPADADGPGALEAGCARYIETALGEAYQSLKSTYCAGLAALNSQAMASGGKLFSALAAAEQDKILSDFEQNKKVGDYADSAAFFELVRRHTLEGMFGDPSYGGNANFAGWDLIGYPGARMYAAPGTQKMDAKIPRSRVSAKQLAHGSD
jgi:gluconate 2-dehydrogenase gamma chain